MGRFQSRTIPTEGDTIKLENVVTPVWMRLGMPLVTWRKHADSQKCIYLTFDDGPTAKGTGQILGILGDFQAQATFFCLGENVESHPARFSAIVDQGHLIGNHSHSHPNGWKTSSRDYVADVARCQEVLRSRLGFEPKYFRPPFGRISFRQLLRLRKRFEVVLWDILGMDYRPEITGQHVARNVIEHATSGSIVVLHDLDQQPERVHVALPLILQHFKDNGFEMRRLDDSD